MTHHARPAVIPLLKQSRGGGGEPVNLVDVRHGKICQPGTIRSLVGTLELLRAEMLSLVSQNRSAITDIRSDHRASATNLLHYLALRRHDIRELQDRLGALGLSSLGRTEADVLRAVETVLDVLTKLSGSTADAHPASGALAEGGDGRSLLRRNTTELLGPAPEHRKVCIMVTAPAEAASDYPLIRDLLLGGMNCLRINCAHDGEEVWSRMIANLRQAEHETGMRARIQMDVGGPKLRTGPIEPGPAVVKCRPRRDAYGRILRPARIRLNSSNQPEPSTGAADAWIPVPEQWLATLRPGDVIRLVDARGAKRVMNVRQAFPGGRWAESAQTIYFTPGLQLRLAKRASRSIGAARVGAIAPKSQAIKLKSGDQLILTRSCEPGRAARYDHEQRLLSPARIGVSLPEIFDCVRLGDPIWLDDGKFGGVVSAVTTGEITVEIKQTPPGGAKLGEGKGINLPESGLHVAALTTDDLKALPFIARNADIIGFSFVRTEADICDLQARLDELGAKHLGIVLKIETRAAFENLPALLLAAMRSQFVGVMIARGDLAVECGYERLAEAQEEILWIAEAAHVPVIWATQVLETLAKTGTPSRSEITDAAMGERAECVMLNKGPYVVEAVKMLDDILTRMQPHHDKKRSMLRRLQLATGFKDIGVGDSRFRVPRTPDHCGAAQASCQPSESPNPSFMSA